MFLKEFQIGTNFDINVDGGNSILFLFNNKHLSSIRIQSVYKKIEKYLIKTDNYFIIKTQKNNIFKFDQHLLKIK